VEIGKALGGKFLKEKDDRARGLIAGELSFNTKIKR